MLLASLLTWWYTRGWGELTKRFLNFLSGVAHQFSVNTLLITLFSPWKQIVSIKDSARAETRFSRLIDNIISRFVGFFVRIFTLIAVGIISTVSIIVGLATVILWPILPVIFMWLLIKGFR